MKQNKLYAVGLTSVGFYDYTTGKHVTGRFCNTDHPNPNRAYLAGEHEALVNQLTDRLVLDSERKKFEKLCATDPSEEKFQEFLVELTKNIEERKLDAARVRAKSTLRKKY